MCLHHLKLRLKQSLLTKSPFTCFTTSFFSTSPLITTTHLKECNSFIHAKLLHQQILVQGLIQLTTDLVDTYITHNAHMYAVSILERLLPSDYAVHKWNALMRNFIHHGLHDDALKLYRRMQKLGWRPDHYTFPLVLKSCGELRSFHAGASIHAVVCTKGFEVNVFACNAVVTMYGRCGMLDDARRMFEEMHERGVGDVVSWNSIISSYAQGGFPKRALVLFARMTHDIQIRPDIATLVNVLPACASLDAWFWGKEIHCYGVRAGLLENVFVANAVIDMYAKCGKIDEANRVFEFMKVKDVVSWNAMVTGYSRIGKFEEAIGLFKKMREEKVMLDVVTWTALIAGYAQFGCGYESIDVFRQMLVSGSEPNVVTLVSLLSGCASAGAFLNGKETHCYALKLFLNFGLIDELTVSNGLIDMYAKCKRPEVARSLFDSIEPINRDIATWTVMICGYAQHGEASDALELFSQMLKRDRFLVPNTFTISCALVACARLSALHIGREIHAYVLRNQHDTVSPVVANCLVDMYSKSGDMDAARVVFNSMQQRNIVSWTSIISGYAMHGRGEEALQLFDDMWRSGVGVDSVTFVVVLYACSHSGMVDRGIYYLNNMKAKFGVVPGVEHYACMVDLFGRAGRLDEALKFIKDMPMEPSPTVWVALLSGCRIHGNIELGEYAAKRLYELDSNNDGSYILLSNMYANVGRWKDVARVRVSMKHGGMRKRPGCSWVQGRKGASVFFAGDRTHPLSPQIYEILSELIERVKELGYVVDTSFALQDVGEEEKGDLVTQHSEKLALAYGILTSAPGRAIRITKNLRICGDCHSAFTYISMIVDNEIIVRDSSRFHHFNKGSCSCKGYW